MRFTGYKIAGDTLTLTGKNGKTLSFDTDSTLIAGPKTKIDAKTAFFTALGNVTCYKVVDGKLYLADASGTTMLTFA